MAGVKIRWHGAAIAAAVQGASREGLRDAVDHLLAASQDLVPIEEATLERSGRATVHDDVGIVSYDTPYAVRQHEDLTLRHDPGRQAKYLEQPATTERPVLLDLVAGPIRRKLR